MLQMHANLDRSNMMFQANSQVGTREPECNLHHCCAETLSAALRIAALGPHIVHMSAAAAPPSRPQFRNSTMARNDVMWCVPHSGCGQLCMLSSGGLASALHLPRSQS